MKNTMTALLSISLLILSSCKNNSPKPSTDAVIKKDSTAPATQTDFFPVPVYIGGQLKIIDSLQLPLNMTVTIHNKTTTGIATNADLRKWAGYFQEPDISASAIKSQYTETNIADQTNPSVTLIYTTSNSQLPVQKINVFIKPDPVASDKVTGIYMEKIFTLQDTVVSQKLYWKTGKNLQVTTEKRIKNITLPAEQVKITWDPS